MKSLLSAFLLISFVASGVADPFVIVVRHAEKATNSDKDPDLSPAGVARAEILGTMLKDSGIKSVFATEFKRTQQTGAVAAKSFGITPTIIQANDTAGLVAKLRDATGNALVVGHGNTIPGLLKALGIDEPISLSESDYSQIFVVSLGLKPQLLRFTYPNELIRFNGYHISTEPSPAK